MHAPEIKITSLMYKSCLEKYIFTTKLISMLYNLTNQIKILNLFNIGTYNPQRENSKISPDKMKVSQKANQRTADVTGVTEATFKIIPMTAITCKIYV